MKGTKRIIPFLFVAALLWAASLTTLLGQELKAKASIDSVVMLIGQQNALRLEVRQPKDVVLNFPLLKETLQNGIEILDQSDVDTTVIDENQLLLKKTYHITSFDSGYYTIAPLRISIDSVSGGGNILTNPLALKVYTFNVDTTQAVFDIKPVEKVPYTFKEMLPWLVGGVLLVALVILFVWLFRRIRNKEPVFAIRKEKPKVPPHVTALAQLEALKKEKLWQTDRIKEFYTSLTDILRVYIEERFNVHAMEQTSEEIMQAMQTIELEGESVLENLDQILKLADLVKFAKTKPLPDENDLSLMNGFLFVNQTKISEVKPIDELIKESNTENEETLK